MINKKLIGQMYRFGIVGILNTIVGYGTYYLLVKLAVNYMFASLVSHTIGVAHSYFWNKYFTFKSKKKSLSQILKFIAVYTVTYLLNLLLLVVLVEYFKFSKEKAGFIALLIVTLASFLGHKFWSFAKKKQKFDSDLNSVRK